MDGPDSYLRPSAELLVRGILAVKVSGGGMEEGSDFVGVLRDMNLLRTWEEILGDAVEETELGSYPCARAAYVRVHCQDGKTGLCQCRIGPRWGCPVVVVFDR